MGIALKMNRRLILHSEFLFLIFNRVCIGSEVWCLALSLNSIVGLLPSVQHGPYTDEPISIMMFYSVISILMVILLNRPAMYFALRTLMAVEFATSYGTPSHVGKNLRVILHMILPLVVLFPLGDLLATIVIWTLISPDDAVACRRITLWMLLLGLGIVVQFLSFLMLLTTPSMVSKSTDEQVLGVIFFVHCCLLAGVLAVGMGIRKICRETERRILCTPPCEEADSTFLSGLVPEAD